MSEWDFLHDMNSQGCSADEIMEAMSTGATAQEWASIEKREKKEPELKKLRALLETNKISKKEFKKREAEILK